MKSNPALRDVIEALPANPFPDAFVVSATDDRPEAMEKLAAEFRRWPASTTCNSTQPGCVASTPCSSWAARRCAARRPAGAGLIAISFSIIRMQTLTHRAEIEVSQLLGATDGFIRRPFLYLRRAARTGWGCGRLAAGGRGSLLAARPVGRIGETIRPRPCPANTWHTRLSPATGICRRPRMAGCPDLPPPASGSGLTAWRALFVDGVWKSHILHPAGAATLESEPLFER
jgi:hypothetical protein